MENKMKKKKNKYILACESCGRYINEDNPRSSNCDDADICIKCNTELSYIDTSCKKNSFKKELTSLINRYSMENDSNTPDYVLADYLFKCLETFNESIKDRNSWYGK
jgi:hypothetical protein